YLEQVRRSALELYLRMKFRQECERVELDQHVVADVPLYAESRSLRVQFCSRPKLHCVRRQRVIRFTPNSRVVPRAQADRYSFKLRKSRRRFERRMQPSYRK